MLCVECGNDNAPPEEWRYLGESERIQTGDFFWNSHNEFWQEVDPMDVGHPACGDWLHALPAYAHEPHEGFGYVRRRED